ncbi:MAG: toll/interleukin-1 receptor domain-containing protein [Agriterribacter sp.]
MVVKKLFFSYSRVDGTAFAQKLALDLKKEGFDVWIDQEDIRAGSEWDMEIEKALESCDCLLFLESEKSVVSNNVLDEVYYALEQRKKVIPVIIHDSKTPYRLQRLQHVDFSKDYDKGLAQLIRELKREATGVTVPHPNGSKLLLKKMIPVIIGLVLFYVATFFLLNQSNKKTTENIAEMPAMKVNDYVGRWELVSIRPEAKMSRAMLKIEAVDTNRININSSLQFFYKPDNDTLHLSVFNGFANCSGCTLQKEMKLATEDVAIGSNHFTILKTDGPEGKAGDTIASRGNNESIKAFSTLHFISDTAAVIKVQSTVPVVLKAGITMEPFVYEFRFRKVGL